MENNGAPDFIESYLAAFANTWDDETPARQVRFVVLDTETTGADARTARLITIGAVAVNRGQIDLSDAYEEIIWIGYTSASVTVHGITRDESREGVEEVEALQSFLTYLRDGVIVGHHIGHDIETINRATERHFGIKLQNQSLDTMDLTLHLKDEDAFSDKPEFEDFSLDALCDLFEVEPHDRHTAGGDAFITAQIFIRLLRIAQNLGRNKLGALTKPYVEK